jgi:predicted CxxxxCH...CXXCH cytochrome family protein
VNSNGGCLQCHALGTAQGTPENNSPFSGLHSFHLGGTVNALCTECHDMANGTTGALSHFTFLDTTQMEGPANQTLTFPGLTGASYDSQNQTCSLTCHGTAHASFSWSGAGSHAVPYLDPAHTQVTQAGFDGNCSTCHAVTGTSPLSSAPLCTTCHQAGSPLTLANCTSCHATPPDNPSTSPAAYPNIAGRHAKHNALAGITDICTTCHDTFDSGTQAHYDRANARPGMDALRVTPGDTNFLSTFNANSGAASFSSSAFTCSNMSCHGGITTLSWLTGTIDVNTNAGCLQCHTLGTALGVPENNSPFSGRHTKHLTGLGSKGNAVCLECHNMANGTTGATNHFAFLDTPQMEGNAGQTVEPLGAAANYNASNQSCTVTCHTQSHSGWLWGGPAASHALGSTWTDPNLGFHGLSGKSDLTDCQSCHSQSGTIAFDGGTAVTSCAACHPAARAHPIPWNEAPQTGFPPYTASHRNSGNQSVACAVCHDVTQGRTPPDSAAPSCFSASFNSVACHSGGPGAANHSVPNLDTTHFQAVQADFTSDCSSCHSLTGTSPVSAAPNCASCHTNIASSNPLTTKNCTSCHADPPTGTTAYPNLERAHAEHDALPEVTGVCSTCHDGLDPGTGASAQLAHYTRAKSQTSPGDVAILSTYDDEPAGGPTFAGLSCSNVSCHGGQTIDWTSSIDVNTNTGCQQCHSLGTTQYNSYNSGEHDRGDHVSRGCTSCHDIANLAPGHFTNLATPAFEQAPSATLRTGLQYNGSTCNPSAGGISGCHGQETW